jgi:hopanoid biosynthesis associated protein HpnK
LRALIIHGDDFGRSPQVNAGILHAHRHGVLTSASLMVAEPACGEAVAEARDYPDLDVGLHVVACNGRSLLPARHLRGLVDEQGFFPRSEVWAGLRYMVSRSLRVRLRDEFRAQIERHLELIGSLSHLDGHHNLNLHPALADILIDLAAEYRVPYFRLVHEPVITTLTLASDHALRKIRDHLLFRWLSARASRRLREHGLKGNDRTFGFLQTGNLTERYVLGVLARLPENSVTQFYFHPALEACHQPPLWPSQAVETRILTGDNIRAAIRQHHIQLTTYRALAEIKASPEQLQRLPNRTTTS